MNFIGREKEINSINKCFKSDELELIVVYGRRRIGKSELIKHCLKQAKYQSLFYECRETTEAQNVTSLSELILKEFDLNGVSFNGIENIFEFIFNKAKSSPFILVLDEYPYLRNKINGLDSIIQSFIDRYKNSSKLKLILCGSYIDIMKSLFEFENPLYGRITLRIDLKQMDYYDSIKFYEGFDLEDKIKLYSVFGGVPYYNRLVNSNLSVKENIIELLASNNSRLETEINIYLRNELNKLENSNAVMDVLAKGVSKYKDILSYSNVPSSPTLADILNKLQKIEIVDKENIIDSKNNKGSYYISDNLTRFYYRYIFRNLSTLSIMDAGVFYDEFIKNDFETSFIPRTFEDIGKQFLIRANLNNQLETPFYKIGKYIYNDRNKRNFEFDIVTLDKKGYIPYEVKYINRPLNDADIDKEIKQVDASDLNTYKYGFISKSGFNIKDKRDDLILYDLNDLFMDFNWQIHRARVII